MTIDLPRKLAATLAVAVLAAGCTETATTAPAPTISAASTLRTGSPEDEQACDRAVRSTTGNADTVILSSSFAQANTEVIVGVGPQNARWRCLVSRGIVAEVMSLTDEGAL